MRPCLWSQRATFWPPDHLGSPPVIKVGRPVWLLLSRVVGSAPYVTSRPPREELASKPGSRRVRTGTGAVA